MAEDFIKVEVRGGWMELGRDSYNCSVNRSNARSALFAKLPISRVNRVTVRMLSVPMRVLYARYRRVNSPGEGRGGQVDTGETYARQSRRIVNYNHYYSTRLRGTS